MNTTKSIPAPLGRLGVTLVELLIVISIMTIITALIIPRIRVINKDRSIREAARVVGAAFASASNRGATDGSGGIFIERNPRYVTTTRDGNTVNFASTRIFQMKNLPDYAGETTDSTANISDPILSLDPDKVDIEVLQVTINDLSPGIVKQNDLIRFDTNPIPYRISYVPPNGGTVFEIAFDNNPFADELDTDQPDFQNGVPAPDGNDLAFVVQRQPRVIESSAVDLPAGYVIDLRYSGPLDLGNEDADEETFTKFGQIDDGDPNTPDSISIIFDRSGGIDSVVYDNQSVLFGEALFLHINEYDPGQINTATNETDTAKTILSRAESLWVTVNHNSGGVNVGDNAPPPPAETDPWELIRQSRILSNNRTNSAQ